MTNADETDQATPDERAAVALRAWAEDVLAPAMTREELVANVRSHGRLDVTERQLRAWVAYGILPPPVRRAPPGSTDRKARALYPRWMFLVVFGLAIAAAEGASIADLKAMAPEGIRRAQEYSLSDSLFVRLDQASLVVSLTPRIPQGLRRSLWSYADRYAEQAKTTVERMTLTIHRVNGEQITTQVDPPIEPTEEGKFPHVFLQKDGRDG